MRKRIVTLANYFLQRLLFSVTGVLYIVFALLYWAIFFPPSQRTPDIENYVLIIGALGIIVAFVATLAISGRANRAEHYPLLGRLPSRIEYLTAVILSTLIFSTLLQFLVAVLALISGPDMTIAQILELPPLWIAPNILAIVLALHASDLVVSGWSRVMVYGILAIILIGQSTHNTFSEWFAGRFSRLGQLFFNANIVALGDASNQAASWLRGDGLPLFDKIFNSIFWPFKAISDAVFSGSFTPAQALAPAIILLYATILFLLAADRFATKDLDLPE